MPKKKYRVALSAQERTTLEHLLRRGKAGTRKLTRARILLKADDGLSDAEMAAALEVGTATVGRTRQRFVECPAVHARWTLRLLADKVVALGFADSIAHETVRQGLKKTTVHRGNKSNGVCWT